MPFHLFDLDGRVAVVTGGYGVLGATMAEALAEAGARVVLIGRNREAADEKGDDIRRKGGEVMVVIADALEEAQLMTARRNILDTWGRIDILVNAAGGHVAGARTDDKPVFALTQTALREVVDLNLYGTVLPTLVFGEAMAERRKGSVVNVSSMAATQAISGVLGYSMAKAAVDNFTKWMAVDLAQRFGDGIRVNAIAPGFYVTTQNRDVLIKPDGSYTDRGRAIVERSPMRRFGKPEELKGPVLWLCSDAASFVTGAVIPVDGGFSAFSGI